MPNLDVLQSICFYQVDADSDYVVTTNVPAEKSFWVTHVYQEDTTIAYYINNDGIEGEVTLQIGRDNAEKTAKTPQMRQVQPTQGWYQSEHFMQQNKKRKHWTKKGGRPVVMYSQ